MKRDELLDLIPAYALGALDDDERTELEAWLQHDPEAQTLAAEYQAMTDHLVALAPPKPVPDRLQADLRRRLAADKTAPVSPSPVVSQPCTPLRPETRPAVRRAVRVVAAAAATAAALALVLLGMVLLRSDSDDTDLPTAAVELYTRLAAQPDAQRFGVVPGEVDAGVSGDLLVSAAGDQAVIRVFQLPDITSDQVFQLWLVDETGTRTSGGLFRSDRSADATYIHVPLDRPVTTYRGFGVSLEPAGGSPYADKPTGPRVFSISLDS